MSTTAEWLRFDGVECGYGNRVVFAGLSGHLTHERIVCIVGPSGAGKSTLIALLAGHMRPWQGTIEFLGERVQRPSPKRPVVFQDDCLFPWMTALDNVAVGPRCSGCSKDEARAIAKALLERFGLGDATDLLPGQLSGGMRQRVGFARALALKPPCVLLDEPLNAIDPEAKSSLIADLRRYLAEGGRAVLVTHELRDAALLADVAIVIRQGGRTVWNRREGDDADRWEKRLVAAMENGAS